MENQNVYMYQLSSHDYESTVKYDFTHITQFTKDEFKIICNDSLKTAVTNSIHKMKIDVCGDIESNELTLYTVIKYEFEPYAYLDHNTFWLDVSNYITELIEILASKGFTYVQPEYEASCSFNDFEHIRDQYDTLIKPLILTKIDTDNIPLITTQDQFDLLCSAIELTNTVEEGREKLKNILHN